MFVRGEGQVHHHHHAHPRVALPHHPRPTLRRVTRLYCRGGETVIIMGQLARHLRGAVDHSYYCFFVVKLSYFLRPTYWQLQPALGGGGGAGGGFTRALGS
jgi:hypothetical protein